MGVIVDGSIIKEPNDRFSALCSSNFLAQNWPHSLRTVHWLIGHNGPLTIESLLATRGVQPPSQRVPRPRATLTKSVNSYWNQYRRLKSKRARVDYSRKHDMIHWSPQEGVKSLVFFWPIYQKYFLYQFSFSTNLFAVYLCFLVSDLFFSWASVSFFPTEYSIKSVSLEKPQR